MSSNSPRHACDQGCDLIIEVLGLVDEKQKLVLLRNNKLFLPFEKSVTTNDSTKFIVDDYMACDQQTNARDVIAINTGSDNKPYYVPLTGGVMLNPARPAKDGKREQARINAAVPYTSLDAHMLTQQAGSDNQALEKIIALPQGFLYVFNNGRLWREIVIDYSQDNCLTFTDLDIATWREQWQEDQPHLPRVIAGQAQDTIWFPQDISAISGEKKNQIDFAFSSEPWSSAYINWLEKGKDRYLSRTQSPVRLFEQFWKEKFDPRTAHYAAPVNDIKPQTPRQPIIEQALLQPTHFLHDLSGQYPREQKNKSESAVKAISDPKTFNAEKLAELEPEFVLPALSKQVSKAGPKKDQKAEIPATEIGEVATGDCFTRVRDKAIHGFMVADVRGAIHQYLSQMESSAGCLSLLCEACYYTPYGTSSMLVNSLVRASKTGTQDNPYHSDKINLQPGTVFASGIMLYERWVMHQNLSSAMASLYRLVSDTPLVINSLRDLFSLDDADYIAGFMEVPALLAALNIKVEDIDKLATKDELKWVRNDSALQGSGADFKKQLSLSGIFDFMGVSEENCTAGNDGSGLFRPHDFEKICDVNHAIWKKSQFDTPYPALFMQREKEQQQAMAVVEKKLVEQQRHSNVAGDLMYEMAVTSFGLMRRVTGGTTALISEYMNAYAKELLEKAKENGTKKQFLTSHIYTGTKKIKSAIYLNSCKIVTQI
ncbi:hypothetical protein [Photobacterium sp.]|uniref:hypothetical protein n=1 Tax=Photobacterium sp. TaxID=660 RepID=UPI00299ED628|nr:hypothetical protein [Photobacterium sp.]MDX1302291.1 hypothetical protein [Photobacterium sp.]